MSNVRSKVQRFKRSRFSDSSPFLTVELLNPLNLERASAQTPFYQGKTIRIVIGSSTGGGYDLWARVLARYYGKYIPGNPTILVQNMPGAASIVATNYLYNVAKPDGLTLGALLPAIYFDQLVGRPEVKFDFAKIGWIGSPEQNDIIHYMRADSPYRNHRRYPQGQRAAALRQFGNRYDRILHPALARRSFGHETYHRQRLSPAVRKSIWPSSAAKSIAGHRWSLLSSGGSLTFPGTRKALSACCSKPTVNAMRVWPMCRRSTSSWINIRLRKPASASRGSS